jgi:hypothetical protein
VIVFRYEQEDVYKSAFFSQNIPKQNSSSGSSYYKVSTVVKMWIVVFWVVILCGLVGGCITSILRVTTQKSTFKTRLLFYLIVYKPLQLNET